MSDLDDDIKALEIGHKWMKDSSLETWFPFTHDELKALKEKVSRLEATISQLRKVLQQDENP